ncbi:MAG: cytochrome c oxidase subunit II [Deltaproteobacteria bacterium]|nr:cytochrome c oxidase subunit II [Deltaproteobacteria bacterium]
MRGIMPEPASSFAGEIDSIINTINWVVGVWFVFAILLLVGFALMFRRKEGVPAQYIAGNTPKQLGILLTLVALIAVFDFGMDISNIKVWHEIKIDQAPYSDPTAQRVRVEAAQWMWSFVYAGADGKFDTEDDVTTDEMHVKLNNLVVYELRSKDVLHSFGVPNMRVKMDVVPGRMYQGWFTPIKEGTFDLHCAEICGRGHGDMASHVVVESPEKFNSWMKEQVAANQAAHSTDTVAALTVK